MIADRFMDLLTELQTDEAAHSGGTLLAHLTATCGLLEDWGNPPEVCVAGLFHSIYGTQYYRKQSADLSERERIRKAIGDDAEDLAYLFCMTDRRGFYEQAGANPAVLADRALETDIEVSPETLRRLLEIEAANFLEQAARQPDFPLEALDRTAERFEAVRDQLSSAAYAAITGFIASRRP